MCHKPLERVNKAMAHHWSKADFGASFWNGALPASSLCVVFLFKRFFQSQHVGHSSMEKNPHLLSVSDIKAASTHKTS